MWGPPPDVEGECNARLRIADDYGDNVGTMRCQRPVGHEGPHQERWRLDRERGAHNCTVTWEGDDRDDDPYDDLDEEDLGLGSDEPE